MNHLDIASLLLQSGAEIQVSCVSPRAWFNCLSPVCLTSLDLTPLVVEC
jgi:hypothetical protein